MLGGGGTGMPRGSPTLTSPPPASVIATLVIAIVANIIVRRPRFAIAASCSSLCNGRARRVPNSPAQIPCRDAAVACILVIRAALVRLNGRDALHPANALRAL